jgi:uncharacterized membrane protein
MWGYRRRLAIDVRRWQERGLITPEAARTILAEMPAARGPSLATVLATLAAVLLGFAAMSFVAANWQVMPKFLRLGLMLTGHAVCYGAAAYLHSRGRSVLAEAMTLAGVLVFGAAIMLVSQMYHMDGHPPDLFLLWGLGALATGLLARAPAALAIALGLMLAWSLMESGLWQAIHWPFLLASAAAAWGFWQLGWRPGMHVTAIALAAWIIGTQLVLGGPFPHLAVAALGVALAVAGIGLDREGGALTQLAPACVGYGAMIGLAGLIGSEVALIDDTALSNWRIEPMPIALRAAPAILLLGGAIAWAGRAGHRSLAKGLTLLLCAQLIFLLITHTATWLVALTGLGFIVAGLAEQRLQGASPATTQTVIGFGLVVAFVGLYDLQFTAPLLTGDDRPLSGRQIARLVVLAAVTLAVVVGVLAWSARHRLTRLQWTGFTLFAIEIVALYSETFGSLMGTSLFFLVASLILAGLAWLALRLHERGKRFGSEAAP